ncbi:MAG: hypothetical protein GC154_12390 [bacterium]|nr:hypothetical protein [bacterium]
MALANCTKCGALFNKMARDICNKCYDEEEQLLRDTQDYLRDNRNAAKWEILDAVEDVDMELLEKWVREKRINLVNLEEEMSKKHCMYCGREVQGPGTICRTCMIKKNVSQKPTLADKMEENEKKDAAPAAQRTGMHFKKR